MMIIVHSIITREFNMKAKGACFCGILCAIAIAIVLQGCNNRDCCCSTNTPGTGGGKKGVDFGRAFSGFAFTVDEGDTTGAKSIEYYTNLSGALNLGITF